MNTTQPQSSEAALNLPSLSERLGVDLSLGVAVEPYLLDEQGPVIAKHFRRLVTENAMKWGELCPVNSDYDFRRADAVADFARAHGMKMTGHTLVWHQMHPQWLFKAGQGPATKALVTERLREHTFRMIERYADVVDNWDVVNEAISEQPDKLWRQSPEQTHWFDTFGGADYVETAFRIAAEATARFAPDTQLYYNDYNIENRNKRQKVIAMIRELRKAGARVDGVGIQGHINLKWPTATELAQTIDEFAAEQLLVKVSELDISIYTEDEPERTVFQRNWDSMPTSSSGWHNATPKSSTSFERRPRPSRA